MQRSGYSVGVFAEPVLTADQLRIEALHSATLNAEIELFDFWYFPNTPLTVAVSLSWTGVGETSSDKNHEHFQSPSFKYNSHSSGTFRDATAVGSITNGTINFTPGPAQSAGLGSVKESTVFILH